MEEGSCQLSVKLAEKRKLLFLALFLSQKPSIQLQGSPLKLSGDGVEGPKKLSLFSKVDVHPSENNKSFYRVQWKLCLFPSWVFGSFVLAKKYFEVKKTPIFIVSKK